MSGGDGDMFGWDRGVFSWVFEFRMSGNSNCTGILFSFGVFNINALIVKSVGLGFYRFVQILALLITSYLIFIYLLNFKCS